MNKHVNNQGFSLIEIMVVIVIMGILTTVVATNVIENIYTGKVTKAKSDIVILESALDFYKMDAGKYPTTEQGLRALIEKPTVKKSLSHIFVPYFPLFSWMLFFKMS